MSEPSVLHAMRNMSASDPRPRRLFTPSSTTRTFRVTVIPVAVNAIQARHGRTEPISIIRPERQAGQCTAIVRVAQFRHTTVTVTFTVFRPFAALMACLRMAKLMAPRIDALSLASSASFGPVTPVLRARIVPHAFRAACRRASPVIIIHEPALAPAPARILENKCRPRIPSGTGSARPLKRKSTMAMAKPIGSEPLPRSGSGRQARRSINVFIVSVLWGEILCVTHRPCPGPPGRGRWAIKGSCRAAGSKSHAAGTIERIC